MTASIGRRQFLAVLGWAAATWPLAGHSQQPPMRVIGYLSLAPGPPNYGLYDRVFLEGLAEAGYVFGRNLAIEFRHALFPKQPEALFAQSAS